MFDDMPLSRQDKTYFQKGMFGLSDGKLFRSQREYTYFNTK